MAAHVCSPVGDFFCPEDRPSPIFSTFAAVISALAGVWTFVVAVSGGCDSAPRTWCLLGCANFLANFIFAFYIYMRFAAKVRGDETTEGMEPGQAACKLFMYDWGVCLYMAALLWQIIWIFLANNVASDHSGDSCSGMLSTAIVLLILYLVIGAILVCFSLFTECCRRPRWQTTRQRANPNPVTAAVQRTGGLFNSLFGPSRRQQPPAQQAYAPQQQPYSPAAPAPRVTPSYYGGGVPPQQASPSYGYPAAPQQASYGYSAGAPPPVNPNYQP
jgi:hypothetical protein